VTLPLLLGAAAGTEWKLFTPKDGGYSVSLPGEPTEAKQDVKTATGNIEVTFYALEAKDGAYVVSHSAFPESALKGGTDDKRLDNARDGAVASAKGRMKSEKKLTLDGFPGREVVIETDAKGMKAVRTRIYAVNKRLFQTLVVGPKSFVQGKDATMFLDSFKLVK